MILGLMLAAASCTSAPTNEKEITQASNQPAEVEMAISQAVKPGIEVLRDNGFAQLKGKRVGLITNPTGVDNHLKSTIDILSEAPEVNLVALFAPEHGVRGDQVAGAMIANEVDKKTGIPVYSLHGKTKKPTPAMLKDIDILVYDIQDIGCRSYTFISTLGLAMEAAAENGKQFMVLDRPNPLGGNKVEGPIVEPGFTSFVSQYPVPYLYGLTPGEFAQFLNNEGKLKGGAKADLSVVAMKGWKRSMTFGDTGMPWVLPSPHIPYPYTALLYPSTGILGELNFVSIGVGYTMPFGVVGAPWINPMDLATALNDAAIPGVEFRPISYTPFYGFLKGEHLGGVQIYIRDEAVAPLTLIQFYVMEQLTKLYPSHKPFAGATASRLNMFDKVCGSDQVRKLFTKAYSVADMKAFWEKDAEKFKTATEKYYLYQ